MDKLPFGRPLSWRADSPLQRLKREQKREYLYSNDLAKVLEREYTISEDLAESKLGKFVTDVLPWLDLPAGAARTLATKPLLLGMLKKDMLRQIEKSFEKRMAAKEISLPALQFRYIKNFYQQIKNAPQSLLDKVRQMTEGSLRFKTPIGKLVPVAFVDWKPGMRQADLFYSLRHICDPNIAAHELGHVATFTEPGLGEKLHRLERALNRLLVKELQMSERTYYNYFSPEELAARYFEHNLGRMFTEGTVSEKVIQEAIKDIDARLQQFRNIMYYKTLKGGAISALKQLYEKGVITPAGPAFSRGRLLQKELNPEIKAQKWLYRGLLLEEKMPLKRRKLLLRKMYGGQ